MTTTHKSNPFGILEHSDSSDEEGFKNNKAKKAPKQPEPSSKSSGQAKTSNKTDTGKHQEQKKAPLKSSGPIGEQNKEQHLKAKEQRKTKGVSDEPHPLDRKSGTKVNPFENKTKRQGGGRFNVGTVNDELKEGDNQNQGQGNDDGEDEEAKEVDAGITLEEWKSKHTAESGQNQVNEAKAKISQQDLLKEMGTATKLSNRNDLEIDDRKVNKKKKAEVIETAALGMNTESKDLLGFKTGFKVFQERKDDRTNDRKDNKQGDKPADKPADSKEVASPEVKEGEEKKDAEGGDKKYGGKYKGNREGGNREGGNREGRDKPYNPNWKNKERAAEKPKVDETSFPKLG